MLDMKKKPGYSNINVCFRKTNRKSNSPRKLCDNNEKL